VLSALTDDRTLVTQGFGVGFAHLPAVAIFALAAEEHRGFQATTLC
jgi:hypothetical protein